LLELNFVQLWCFCCEIINSNELGKNAIRILGFGINATACEDVMIFERRVQHLE